MEIKNTNNINLGRKNTLSGMLEQMVSDMEVGSHVMDLSGNKPDSVRTLFGKEARKFPDRKYRMLKISATEVMVIREK